MAEPDDPAAQASDPRSALLEQAREAARRGQPHRMIEALTLSGFTAGLLRRFQSQWPRMPRSEIEEHIARAVDDAYAALSAGRRVTNLTAWIFKASHNRIHDHWRSDFSRRVDNPDVLDEVAAPTPLTDGERAEHEREAEGHRLEAIRLARGLLPKIGQGQVVDVMSVVIDAVEAGVADLSPADVAQATGTSPDAARALISRGFNRLARAARDAGIELPAALPEAAESAAADDNHRDEEEQS